MKKIALVLAFLMLNGCNVNKIDELNIEKKPSIHFSKRREKTKIDTCVFHSTECDSLEESLKYMDKTGSSAHYIISRNGKIIELVDPKYEAFHAGKSIMPFPDNRISVNRFSIGIELVCGENSEFTEEQYLSLARLCKKLEQKYGPLKYISHSDISGQRLIDYNLRDKSDLKKDPGKKFNWGKFYKRLDYFLNN